MHKPKIALVYDRINKFGGAEQVLKALHEIYPKAPLYTGVYHPKKAGWAKGWDIRPSFVNHYPFAKKNHEWYFSVMPHAFESFDLSNFDIVISVTSAEAKGVITKPEQLHISYLLTPTRYLWSHTHQYQGSGVKRTLLHPLFTKLRRWDYIASKRPDKIVTISNHVSKRVKKYYRREPDAVIYPPVNTKLFDPKEVVGKDNYFLVVSRLVDYKNIDLVIKTFNQLPQEKLVIVGTGKAKRRLKRLAQKNTEFKGQVSQKHLVKLYQKAQALIFPQEEDFGITAVESVSSNTPVIAYHTGGAAETVVAGESGVFFEKLEEESLKQAIIAFQSMNWYDKNIQRSAARFDATVFKQAFKQYVEDAWEKHQANRK